VAESAAPQSGVVNGAEDAHAVNHGGRGSIAILRVSQRPVGRDAYDAVHAALDLDPQHPPGLMMHGATEIDGEMAVAQVWESLEYANRFDVERLNPMLTALGVTLKGKLMLFELTNLVTP
jgi:hypothetical protein